MYFSETPRPVALQTKPHDEDHKEDTRGVLAVNVSHEMRRQAHIQAREFGHIHWLPESRIFGNDPQLSGDFYFRFGIDILCTP
jgi:hypothetical protein